MIGDTSDQMSISPKSRSRSRSRSPIHKKRFSSSSSDDMFVKTPEIQKNHGQIRLGGELEDTKGYYIPQVGEILLDLSQRYKILAVKGKGVYSCVVEVQSLENGEKSAVKVLRNNEVMLKSGEKEVKILQKLHEKDPNDRRHIIKLQGSFTFQGHFCAKFELLGMNLREVLSKYGNNTGLSLAAVKSFARQGFIALFHIKSEQILHCDIKPDNILITQDMRKIKLSDFGSALESGENKITDNLVARYYRPPEIYLGYPYDYSLDVWSFACTLFELFTGKVLFPGCSDSHVLKLMMEVKGGIPKKMRNQGQFVDRFFDQFQFVYNDGEGVKKIPIGEVKKEKSLVNMLGLQDCEEKDEVLKLGNLLEQCLQLDPNERITPETALLHPFLTK